MPSLAWLQLENGLLGTQGAELLTLPMPQRPTLRLKVRPEKRGKKHWGQWGKHVS